jgi:hypothetical protein
MNHLRSLALPPPVTISTGLSDAEIAEVVTGQARQ